MIEKTHQPTRLCTLTPRSKKCNPLHVDCTHFSLKMLLIPTARQSYKAHFAFVTDPLFLQAVNELLESLGAPLEIVDGFVSSIAVTIPWQALLTDHCTLEVSGLQITCRPKYRTSKFSEKQLSVSNWRIPP